jgi:hypothetical protein
MGYSHCCVNLIVLYKCNTQSWYVPLIEQFSDIFIKSHDLETVFSVIRAFWWTNIIRIFEIWSSGERSGALSLRGAYKVACLTKTTQSYYCPVSTNPMI